MPELGKYNQAKTITFDLVAPDGVDLITNATFAAGDVVLMSDEGAEANTTNLPTDEGTGYSLVLTAAEMSMARGRVYIIDQTGTKVWLDKSIGIETYGDPNAEHAFDLDTASTAQTGDSFARLGAPAGASVSADVADIPTVSEFNARTLASADYFDPAADAVATVTNLTNLPSIPANWLTAAGIAASALDGKGDWNIGKTGYTLTQAFPNNFSDLSISVTTGQVELLTATQASIDAIEADTNELQSDDIPTLIAALPTASEINAEMVDVMEVDTHAQPSSVPAATTTYQNMFTYAFALGRNKMTQTATTTLLRNDADSATIGTSTVSDDATTFTKGKFV